MIKSKYAVCQIWKLIFWDQNEKEYSANLYIKDNSQSMLDKALWEILRPIHLKKRGNMLSNSF